MGRCYRCGTVVPKDELACTHCGGTDITDGHVRPVTVVSQPQTPYLWPWAHLAFPPGHSILLTGGKGLGKTSISLLLKPDYYITNEQEPADVAAVIARVTPDRLGQVKIAAVQDVAQAQLMMFDVPKGGTVVIDSLAEFGVEGAVEVARQYRRWAQRFRGRVVFINQLTKDGKGAGREALEHLVDAVFRLSGDEAGGRHLDTAKARGGPLFCCEFAFTPSGGIGRPHLKLAYSVEGRTGAYRLVPVPSAGAKWQDLYRDLPEGFPISGTAACARRAPMYGSGWMEPADVDARRAFAEQHGLTWLDPSQAGGAGHDV